MTSDFSDMYDLETIRTHKEASYDRWLKASSRNRSWDHRDVVNALVDYMQWDHEIEMLEG